MKKRRPKVRKVPRKPGRLTELTEADGSAALEVLREDLQVLDHDEFAAACARLRVTRRKRLVLDLRRLQNLRSLFVGVIVRLSADVAEGSGRLTVLASGRVLHVLEMFADEADFDLTSG